MPVDYSRGKIYKIVCNTTGLVYVGSTCEPTLAKRLTKHVADYKYWLNGKTLKFVTSFKVLENDDYEIMLLELYPCNSKDELHARERYWTNQIDCVNRYKNQGIYAEIGEKEYKKQYNKQHYETNTEHKKQYYENNKEDIIKRQKQYYKHNKDSIIKRQKQYCANNKESIKQYKKQYRKDNKEYYKKYFKQYYEKNKEKLNQKIVCECGRCYCLSRKASHFKTKHHQYYEENRIYYVIKKGLDIIKEIEKLN